MLFRSSSEGIDGAPGRSAEEGAVGVEGIEGEEGAEGTEALPPDAGVLTFVVPSWSATGLVALTLTLAMATLVCKLRFPRMRRSDHALSRLSGEGSPRFLTFTKPVALPRVLVTWTLARIRSTGDVTSKHPDRQAMPMRKPTLALEGSGKSKVGDLEERLSPSNISSHVKMSDQEVNWASTGQFGVFCHPALPTHHHA